MNCQRIFAIFLIGFAVIVASNSAYAAEPNAPCSTIHFRPDSGVLGDVIPLYWQGAYHVFYLKGSNWGHIVSEDLVHWRQLADAIKKGEGESAPDAENCWTGSIVESGGIFHLFYTGKNSRDPKGDQKVMQAISKDLIKWEKASDKTFYADGAIYWNKCVNGSIDDKQIYHHQAFRDPEVFRPVQDGKWRMLLHSVLADGSLPAIALYESDDLFQWTPRQPLMTMPKTLSCDCPHIFPLDGKWLIIAADRHYSIADSPDGPFSTDMQPYDCGEIFVAKTLFDGKRRVLFGWIADREKGKDSGKGLWGGYMSMPRELYLDAQNRLCQRPAREIVGAFSKIVKDLPQGPAFGTPLDAPDDFMMRCALHAKNSEAKASIALRASKDDPESGYRINVDFKSKTVTLCDRHRAYERMCNFDADEPLEIRAFVVGSVIECFINDAYCFSMRACDYLSGSLKIDAASDSLDVGDFSIRVLATEK